MCGFAGEYLLDRSAEVDPIVLRQRVTRLRHRGPEEVGTWHDRHVGLSHARLKLLDLEHGLQPMRSARGTVLSYNGEIYNNAELRAELTVFGFGFQTRSDTEVLLAAYETWGTAAWERLNGMFAFAIYDPARERLFLVRDRLGIKPVFYRVTARAVEFASEPSAWEHLHDPRAKLDPTGVLHFLRFAQPVFESRTIFEDLKALEPGTQLVIGPDGVAVERWFSPAAVCASPATEGEAVIRARLRHLMHLSVGRQMVADVPVGVYLSGGVDSAIVTGLLAQVAPQPPHTFTIALEGDESEFLPAAAVARRWKCPHHRVTVSPGQFFGAMSELINLRHFPVVFPNEVMIYLLAQEAAVHVKAALTGEGADELFGGYTRILHTLDLYQRARQAEQAGDSLLRDTLRLQNPQFDFRSDSRFFASVYSWLHADELESLLTQPWRNALHDYEESDPFAATLEWFPIEAGANRFHWLLEFVHLPNLLARLDGATMAASLEGRVPYTDVDLMRYVTALPPNLKYMPHHPDKPLLRRTFADLLPAEVIERPKRAFDASLERLFRSPEGQAALDRIGRDGPMLELFDRASLRTWLDRNRDSEHHLKTWLLLSLGLWMNRNML